MTTSADVLCDRLLDGRPPGILLRFFLLKLCNRIAIDSLVLDKVLDHGLCDVEYQADRSLGELFLLQVRRNELQLLDAKVLFLKLFFSSCC